MVLGQSYPVSWRLYRRRTTCEEEGIPFASKPELARTMVEAFQPLPGTQTYVLTDSWYPSQQLLETCRERGFHLISAVKSDRKFRVAGHNLQAKAWAQALPKRAFDFVTVNTAGYKLWSTVGRLSSGHQDLFPVERHVQLMMVAHAYLEMQRQEAQAAVSEPEVRITLGDIQRQHQALSRRITSSQKSRYRDNKANGRSYIA